LFAALLLLYLKLCKEKNNYNGYGLAMWRYLKIVSPLLLLNKVTNVDVKNYSLALFIGWNLSRIANKKLSLYILQPA
jgi:hypothetical protein